ncbi:MAG: ZIP family metal transporter [Thermomicrobiales bacterium]
MLNAALWGGLSASSLIVGALIALHRPVRSSIIGLVMGFGAGALISAISFELIGDALENSAEFSSIASGLAVGALSFFVGDWYVDQRGGEKRKQINPSDDIGDPNAIVIGTVLDGIPESLVIGVSLVAGGGVSVAMVAAAFISNVPESLSATTGLWKSGVPKASIMRMWFVIVAISGVSAAVGYLILESSPASWTAVIQSFAAGAVLTMLADSMMPEAFAKGGKLVGLVTVLGFAIAVWISSIQ